MALSLPARVFCPAFCAVGQWSGRGEDGSFPSSGAGGPQKCQGAKGNGGGKDTGRRRRPQRRVTSEHLWHTVTGLSNPQDRSHVLPVIIVPRRYLSLFCRRGNRLRLAGDTWPVSGGARLRPDCSVRPRPYCGSQRMATSPGGRFMPGGHDRHPLTPTPGLWPGQTLRSPRTGRGLSSWRQWLTLDKGWPVPTPGDSSARWGPRAPCPGCGPCPCSPPLHTSSLRGLDV